MSDQWDQAVAYVQALRGQGYAEGEIGTALRGVGWGEGEIQKLLSGGAPAPGQPPPPPAQSPPPAAAPPLPQAQPPPQVAAPPLAPAPATYAPRPVAARSGSKAPLIVAIMGLGVVLLAGVALGAFFLGRSRAAAPGGPSVVERTKPDTPETRPGAETDDGTETDDDAESPDSAGTPDGAGHARAVAAALEIVPEGSWQCLPVTQTEDWREVSVWCRELDEQGAATDYVYEVGLRWIDEDREYEGAYDLIVLKPGPTPGEPEVVETWDGRPCQGGALAKAMEGMEQDWIALAESRTQDWSRATIWLGPPASEYVLKLTMKWSPDRKVYETISTESLEGNEEPPEETRVED